MDQMQYVEAITHFVEAGENMKGVDAAIHGRQWARALEILEQQHSDEDPETAKLYKQLGESSSHFRLSIIEILLLSILGHHFSQSQEFEQAERCFIKAQCPGECVEMYNRAAKWDHAFRKFGFLLDVSYLLRIYIYICIFYYRLS